MVKILQKAKFVVVFVTLVVLLGICVHSANNVITMSLNIYYQGKDYETSEEMPNGTWVANTSSKAGDSTLAVDQLPCGREGKYYLYSSVSSSVTGSGTTLNAMGAPCNSISGDYSEVYNCSLYTVDWDNNESFCKQGKTPTSYACFGKIGGVWEPAPADNGKGECCGDDPAGYNPFGNDPDHSIDDPDMGKISCKTCPVGLNSEGGNRFWSDSVRTIANDQGCCGDDASDCLKLVGSNDNFLCGDVGGIYTNPSAAAPCVYGLSIEECQQDISGTASPSTQQGSGGKWYWANSAQAQGMIFNVSCASIATVSNGQRWIGCTNASFHPTGPVKKTACVFSLSEEVVFETVSPLASTT